MNSESIPLCVDLDGTLVQTDLLHESALMLVRRDPLDLLRLPFWLARGRAHCKAEIARRVVPDASLLPYHHGLLQWLRTQKQSGRRLVLATASDDAPARAVADHLGIFDDVIASNGRVNNSGRRKAQALIDRFGRVGYDYAGNGRDDIPPWAASRAAIVVGDASVLAMAGTVARVEQHFDATPVGVGVWVRSLRLHQWLKNLLLFLPLLGAHRWGDVEALFTIAIAFFAFGLCASGVYVVNDLTDIESDRAHPRKRQRPFAAGRIPIPWGLGVAALLFAGAFALAAIAVGPGFTGWLLGYLVLTKAYSFGLKALPLIDCLALAGLYALRVVAGGAAVAQPVSFWLLAFCLFLFLSLAFVKRFAEIVVMTMRGTTTLKGRAYGVEDRSLLQTFGVAAGFSAALVLALYLNSDAVRTLYVHSERLWLALPVLLFWILWMWLQASRGQMHDDPVVYAVRDRASLIAGLLFVCALAFAR